MLAAEVGRLVETNLSVGLGVQIPGQGHEQAPGGLVILGNRGVEVMHVGTVVPGQDRFQHALAQALAAAGLMYRHLPDEQRVGLIGRNVTGDEAHQLAVQFCCDAGVRKVGTLQQVAVHGIGVQGGLASTSLFRR